jgi:squalene-associated FAD-dependent desaturase
MRKQLEDFQQTSVTILGGGLAGLASAITLGQRGFKVTLLESRNRLGGRASSFVDAITGQVIDACQHVSMGCCTNFTHFCRTVGIDSFLQAQSPLYFMTPDRKISRLEADPVPAPFHLARSLLRSHYLNLGEKIQIAWGLLCLRLANPNDDQPLLRWLKCHRQTDRTIRRFWATVLTSALNESIDRMGLKYARKVFVDGFLRHRKGFEVQLPTVPLIRFYGEELQQTLQKNGIEVHLNTGVKTIEIDKKKVHQLRLRDDRVLQADWYISSVPFERFLGLMPEEVIRENPTFQQISLLEPSPITSIHFWFDQPICAYPHLVLIDCLSQWVFNRGEIVPGEHYLQVVVSASHEAKTLGREKLIEAIYSELLHILPEVAKAKLIRSKVITEHSATFSAFPGVDNIRSPQETPISNLILSGDWTRTGWPATMEGAVRSGYLASEIILNRTGRPERLVQPDL